MVHGQGQRPSWTQPRAQEALDQFNRYRSPEACAELLSARETKITVKLSGSFCDVCGYHDYVDDLRFELEDKRLKTKINKYVENPLEPVVLFERTQMRAKHKE